MLAVETPKESRVRRVLQPEDLLSLAFVGDVQVSPDGSRLAFVRTTIDADSNEYRSRVCVMPVTSETTAEPPPFTGGPRRDHSPRWSPSGDRLAFVSDRKGDAQIWVMPADGGEARQVTRVKGGASGPVWSPDGRYLAFTARLGEEGILPATDGGKGDGRDEDEKDPARRYTKDVRVIDRIWYRLDDLGYFDGKYSQVCVAEVETERTVQLTAGRLDAESPAWSPDGLQLAFSSNRLPNGERQPSVSDIHVLSFRPEDLAGLSAIREPRTLTSGRGPASQPAWSPDGRTIAFLGNHQERGWYTNTHIWLVPAEGGEARRLTGDFDQTFGDQAVTDLRGHGNGPALRWSEDGRTLFCAFSQGGTVHLAAVDAADGRVTPVTSGDRLVYSVALDRSCRTLGYVATDPLLPGDVFVARLDDSLQAVDERRLTEINRELLQAVSLAPTERFTFQAGGGPRADGWVVKPVGFEPGKTYPAVLEIHGGPMAMYGNAFFLEFQLLAARGLAVVYTNPRGSYGYGQDFVAAIRGDWGNLDYQDLMAGLEAALAFGFIDPARLGVAGGSYGGFMTNWMIGHTDRFKAAVTMRSVVNEYSFFGTSDLGFSDDEEFGCLPWQDPERYRRLSPVSYVERMRTPLLILHSEEDYRCPISQAEELYASLKKLDQEVVFVRFPGESHELSRSGKPWHRVLRLEKIVDWFGQRL